MNVWISQSVDLIKSVASFLTSSPVFYLVGCFAFLVAVKLFKRLFGG